MTFRFSYFFYENTKASNFKAQQYGVEGKESNDDKHTELARTVDLKNPDQLPVKEIFESILSHILS